MGGATVGIVDLADDNLGVADPEAITKLHKYVLHKSQASYTGMRNMLRKGMGADTIVNFDDSRHTKLLCSD